MLRERHENHWPCRLHRMPVFRITHYAYDLEIAAVRREIKPKCLPMGSSFL